MENLVASFLNGDFLSAGSPVEFKASRKLSKDSTLSAITLKNGGNVIKGRVSLKDESTAQIATDGLKPGAYEVTINHLADKENRVLTEDESIGFIIGALKGTYPKDKSIVHAVQLAIGELTSDRLTPGDEAPKGTTYVEVAKVMDRSTGDTELLAFSANGDATDPFKEIRALQQRRFDKYGKMSESLYRRLASLKDTDQITVGILPIIDFDYTDFRKPESGVLTEAPKEQDQLIEKIGDRHIQVLKSFGVEFKKLSDGLALLSTTTVAKVRQIAESDGIGFVDFEDPEKKLGLASSLAVSRNAIQRLTWGMEGRNVKVAVWEDGQKTGNLVIEKKWREDPPDETPQQHSRWCSGIIKNDGGAGDPRGYAPSCTFFAANDSTHDSLTWAMGQGVTSMSQSWSWNDSRTSDEDSWDDVWKDMQTKKFPFPFIAAITGNQGDVGDPKVPDDEFVNNKGYSQLIVGGHDDTAAGFYNSTVFRNPWSTHGDRELPNISANATGVSIFGSSVSGTSFAAPAVAGVAACIQEANSELKMWPEAQRAILMAAASPKIAGGTWASNIAAKTDTKDGAGPMDALESVQIAQKRVFTNNQPIARGWTASTVGPTDFNRVHFIRDGSPGGPSSKLKIKVALAWNGHAHTTWLGYTYQWLSMDLDLRVTEVDSGTIMANSTSFNNSVEIVEFDGKMGKTYRIDISKSLNPEDQEDWPTFCGIAWRATRA